MHPPRRSEGLGAGVVWPSMFCGKPRKSGRAEAGVLFCGANDNEYALRAMMCVDNFWLFCDNKDRLVSMVNDIIEELLDLEMEPKPESLWWTSSNKDEGGRQREHLGSALQGGVRRPALSFPS